MSANTLPTYQAAQQQITSEDPVSTPAEMHGLMCGLVCASQENLLLPKQYKDSAIMTALYPQIVEQFSHALDQDTFTIELLLPDDEQPLSVRTEAIGEWAQGFIAGLGEGGFKIINSNPSIQEVLEDFQAIAQIQGGDAMNDSGIDEDDEKAFFEVQEYMRMAVLTIYTDLVIANSMDKKSDTVH